MIMIRKILFKLKKILPLFFILSISASPVLAWGNGDCSYSKKRVSQETTSENMEKSETTKEE